jgi:hypothetical protein
MRSAVPNPGKNNISFLSKTVVYETVCLYDHTFFNNLLARLFTK